MRIARDVGILGGDGFGGVQEHDRHLAALEALERHDHRELLEDLGHAPLAPDARGVDEQVPPVAERQRRVHRVAGGAGGGVNQHPLLAQDRVDQ